MQWEIPTSGGVSQLAPKQIYTKTHLEKCYMYDCKKSKITKILNLQENLIRKSIITWQNQITKHIKNEWARAVIYVWLGTGIFKCKKRWIKPGFIALTLSLWWQSHCDSCLRVTNGIDVTVYLSAMIQKAIIWISHCWRLPGRL